MNQNIIDKAILVLVKAGYTVTGPTGQNATPVVPSKPRKPARSLAERVDATLATEDAPHGRDANGKPLAPFGYTKTGKVRKSKAGRPPKAASAAPTPPRAPKPTQTRRPASKPAQGLKLDLSNPFAPKAPAPSVPESTVTDSGDDFLDSELSDLDAIFA